MSRNVVIIGAGGHARGLGEIVQMTSGLNLLGWIDRAEKGKLIDEAPVLGDDADIELVLNADLNEVIIGVGSVGDTSIRRRIAHSLEKIEADFVTLKHPRSVVSTGAFLGKGVCVCAAAVVQRGANVGAHTIVNSASVIEHDTQLGKFCHVAPGAVISGDVVVGDDVHIGANAVVKQGVRVGAGAIVGAGAVVVNNVLAGEIVVGCPAVPIEKRKKK